jgi:NDP-sugar pyrophosphorylase family protein
MRVGAEGRIRAFDEKSGNGRGGWETKRQLINGGVYVFERKLLKMIPTRRAISLEGEVFPSLLAKKRVYGFTSDAYFLDIGVPEDLGRAQRELPERILVSHPG